MIEMVCSFSIAYISKASVQAKACLQGAMNFPGGSKPVHKVIFE